MKKNIINKLIRRSLKSEQRRNFYVVMAIILTTFMLASVFSVAMSMAESMRIQRIRIGGSSAHVSFLHPTREQLDRLGTLDYVKTAGLSSYTASVRNLEQTGISIDMVYADRDLYDIRTPAYTDIVGEYPREEDEIMVSRHVLKKLGIQEPEPGIKIPLTCQVWGEDTVLEKVFTLTGYYQSYDSWKNDNDIYVSEALFLKYGKTFPEGGSVSIVFRDGNRAVEYALQLKSDLEVSQEQQMTIRPAFNIDYSKQIPTIISIAAIVLFLMLTGFLLIYNALYISVNRNIRFYGLLKTIGVTSGQVRKIVYGQIFRLCAAGIPIGAGLAAIVSLIIVPVIVVVQTGAVVSFSPFIFLGAAVFAFAAALAGAARPARKAAGIPPVEAIKYIGHIPGKKRIRVSAQGKPFRIAIRNIFRDRKRAAIVMASLFLGMTTFLVITTVIYGIDIQKYIGSYYDSDLVIRKNINYATGNIHPGFDDGSLEKLQELPGFEHMYPVTLEQYESKYTPEFETYIQEMVDEQLEYESTNGMATIGRETYEAYFKENFTGTIAGMDKTLLNALNHTLPVPIDTDAFERGEFALLATDEPALFEAVKDMEITCVSSGKTFVIPVGGFVPRDFKYIFTQTAPILFVSNAFLDRYTEQRAVNTVNIDISEGYDEQALTAIKEIFTEDEISIISKFEETKAIRDGITVMYILGGGISAILSLIGIMNFINVMSISIITRKRELALMESVGMRKKQLRQMLVYEGMGYAGATLLLTAVFGNAAAIYIYRLIELNIDFMTFRYPIIPFVITCIIVLAVCGISPLMTYRGIQKATVVERLREVE